MNREGFDQVQTDDPDEFFRIMNSECPVSGNCVAGPGKRMNIDRENVKNGLAQLVLTLIKFLHELLEMQAVKRIDDDSLSEGEIERLGVTLMRQAEEIDSLRKLFGLEKEDLNIDLGPLGKLL
jgi:hypothetical protein